MYQLKKMLDDLVDYTFKDDPKCRGTDQSTKRAAEILGLRRTSPLTQSSRRGI